MKGKILSNGIVIVDVLTRNIHGVDNEYYIGRYSDGSRSIPLSINLLQHMLDNRSPKEFAKTFKNYKQVREGFVFPNGMRLIKQEGKNSRGEYLYIAESPYGQKTSPKTKHSIARIVVGDFITPVGRHIAPNVFITDFVLLTGENRLNSCKYKVYTTHKKYIGDFLLHETKTLTNYDYAESLLGYTTLKGDVVVDYKHIKGKLFEYTLRTPNNETYKTRSSYNIFHPFANRTRYYYPDCVGMVLENGIKIVECVRNEREGRGYLLIGELPDGSKTKPKSIQQLKTFVKPIIPVKTHEGEILANGVKLIKFVPPDKFIAQYCDGSITPQPIPYGRLKNCSGRPVQWAHLKVGTITKNGFKIIEHIGRSRHGAALFRAEKNDRVVEGTYQQICNKKDFNELILTNIGVSKISQSYFDFIANHLKHIKFQYYKTTGEKILHYSTDQRDNAFYRLDCVAVVGDKKYNIEYDGVNHPKFLGDIDYVCWDNIISKFNTITYDQSLKDWSYDRSRDMEVLNRDYKAVIRINCETTQEQALTAINDIINNDITGIFLVNKDNIKKFQLQQCDLKVVDYQFATGRFEGMLGALVCESADGKVQVKVGTGFSEQQRKQFTRDYIVGKIITVQYNMRIKDKNRPDVDSLFLPRFVEVREDKDQANTSDQIV